MSLRPQQLLQNLAVAQALLVAPQLGEAYAGKTAQTIASLMLMLAADFATFADRHFRARAALVEILTSAEVGDLALAADIRLLTADLESIPLHDRMDRLLQLFTLLHAWADSNDPALAARCRRFLVEMTAAEVLSPPALDLPG